MQIVRRKMLSVAAAVVCLVLAGCDGGSSSSSRTPAADRIVPGPVRGTVIADEPVAGALVQLYTHDGQLLPGEALTDHDGAFEIPIADARRGLRVVATGGSTASQGHFHGTLSSYIEPFDNAFEVPVTPVTTMVDRLRLSSHYSAAEAELRMAFFLDLEPGRFVRSDFRYLRDFNSRVFMRATAPVGFDSLVDELVAEAAKDSSSQRRFPNELPQGSALASVLALELVKGAVHGSGSAVAGSLFAKIGLDSGTAEILGELRAIRQQLSALQALVEDVARDVQKIKTDLSVQQAVALISRIKTINNDIELMEQLAGKAGNEQALKDLRDRTIRYLLNTIYYDRNLRSDLLNGDLNPDGDSPIQYYAEYIGKNTYFYSSAHYKKFVSFVEFYDAYNILLHYLLMDALNSESILKTGKPDPLVPLIAEDLERARNRYLARLPRALPDESAFIEVSTLRMWYGTWFLKGRHPFLPDRSYYEKPWNIITKPGPLKYGVMPEELESLGGWMLPFTDDFDRGMNKGGLQGIINRGAPAHLFTGPMNAWTAWGHPELGEAYTFAVNHGKYYFNDYTFRAWSFLYRQMQHEEARDYWLPWLYPERAAARLSVE